MITYVFSPVGRALPDATGSSISICRAAPDLPGGRQHRMTRRKSLTENDTRGDTFVPLGPIRYDALELVIKLNSSPEAEETL